MIEHLYQILLHVGAAYAVFLKLVGGFTYNALAHSLEDDPEYTSRDVWRISYWDFIAAWSVWVSPELEERLASKWHQARTSLNSMRTASTTTRLMQTFSRLLSGFKTLLMGRLR